MDMSEVKAFNAELSGLYDNKPPISKAKMSAITKGAIKAIKFYKHVVHSVEKFIQKCKPEYKVPGLYVIDSIVRQSRHQFGQDKDVFAPRFAKNMQQTFANLFRCPPEEKRNIIRVLNLWQKNNVFSPQVIQPLLDMADPNHPLHQEIQQQNNAANGSSLNMTHNSDSKISPMPISQHTPRSSTPMGDQFQDQPSSQSNMKFNRKLLNDFEYESEDEPPPEPAPAPASAPSSASAHAHSHSHSHTTHNSHNPADALGSILTNPEIMRQLQSLQAQMQMMTGMQIPNLMPMMTDMQLQQNQNLPFLNSQDQQKQNEPKDDMANESDIEFVETGPQVIEIPDANDSRSPSPKSRRRSRSASPRRRRRSRSRSRSRSPRRRRNRDRDRDRDRDKDRDREKQVYSKEREAEKEKNREREKKGLPPMKKENLSVCSTTLWVGHLSKLATQEELSDLFGGVGGVVAIDLVPPRGCAFVVMERRRDALKALTKLNKHKLHSKEIMVAWAPGRGVKGREWKDYWEAELGVSYLPWSALQARWALNALSLDALEDGGCVDEDTLPPWLPPRILPKAMIDNMGMLGGVGVGVGVGVGPGMLPLGAGVGLGGAMPLPTPPPAIPLPVPRMPHGIPTGLPPGLPPGLPAGIRPPSLPTGVPGLPGDAGMPPGGPLLRFPHGMPPQSMPPQPGMVGGFLGGLLGVGGLVGGLPLQLPSAISTPPPNIQQQQQQQQQQHQQLQQQQLQHQQQQQRPEPPSDDAMDLDTEDNHEIPASSPHLPEQLQALLSKPPPNFNASEPPPGFNLSEPPPFNASQPPPDDKQGDDRKDRDRDRKDRDRDRDRDRRDRDRREGRDGRDRDRRDGRDRDRGDRGRDRDRDRDRDRGRDRRDRDRDRDRDRFSSRDNNRERSKEKSPHRNTEHSGQEKSLQERLWEMANGKPASRQEDKPKDDYGDKEETRGEELRTERSSLHDRPPPGHDAEGENSGPGVGSNGTPTSGGQTGPTGAPMGAPGAPPGAPGGWTQLPRMPPPHMPPFRAELRMRGPPRPGMAGPWMDGPPRFNGMGPPFNRPPFERPPFDGPMFDGPPRFDRPPFNRMPFDAINRPPFDGPRPPFDGPIAAFDGPRPAFDGPRPAFDGPRPAFDGPRPPFDGPRPPFDGPRPPFDGPRPPFDGPRPPFDGPRPPFDRPRQFDGERSFDGPPRFDGPPEFFDRNNRRFEEREQFNDRGWNGDRDSRDNRDWDRRNEWDDRRRDRRSRDNHDDSRFRDRNDRNDRNDRRRNFDDRSRPQRDSRDGSRDGPRDSRDASRDSRDGQRDSRDGQRDSRDVPRDTRDGPRDTRDGSKDTRDGSRDSRDGPKDSRDTPKDSAKEAHKEIPKDVSKESQREERNSRRDKDRKSRWGAAEENVSQDQERIPDNVESQLSSIETAVNNDSASKIELHKAQTTEEAESDRAIEPEINREPVTQSAIDNNCNEQQTYSDVRNYETRSEVVEENTEITRDDSAQYDSEQNQPKVVEKEPDDVIKEVATDLYDANEAVDTSFSMPPPLAEEVVSAQPPEVSKEISDNSGNVDMFGETKEASVESESTTTNEVKEATA